MALGSPPKNGDEVICCFLLAAFSDDAQAVVVEVFEAVGTALDEFHLAVEALGDAVVPSRDVMQMDEAMAATAAVLDGLVHVRRGVIHLFAGVSKRAGACAFSDVRVEGGFLVSAVRDAQAEVQLVTIAARRAGLVRIKNPWPSHVTEAPTVERHLESGESVTILESSF